jgi:predicted DNA-binding transcriptional regulator AlpA
MKKSLNIQASNSSGHRYLESNEIPKKYLNVKQTSFFTGLSESRIRYEVFRRQIPYLKIGRSIRFCSQDLIDWLESKKINSNTFSSS